jgi:DeoR family transcriptional regulator of aga operon
MDSTATDSAAPTGLGRPLLTEQRQELYLTHLSTHGGAQVSELSGLFGVSMSTVRRDLQEMEDAGLVRRVHGGAVLAGDRSERTEAAALLRVAEHAAHKGRIGAVAGGLVQDGSTIIITGGTTTAAMIPYLNGKSNVTVITNALNIAYDLAAQPEIDVIVLGGWLRHSEYSLLGHLTLQALQDLRADMAFHGIFGIDAAHGLTGTSIQEVQTDRGILAAAREICILVDHTKWGRIGPVRVAPIEDISLVVTDREAPEAAVSEVEQRDIRVIRA